MIPDRFNVKKKKKFQHFPVLQLQVAKDILRKM